MKKISIKEVMDYCFCPMFYYLRYLANQRVDDSAMVNEKYDHDLHLTLYNYFNILQNNERSKIGHLKRTWGSLWIGKRGASEFITTTIPDKKDTFNGRRRSGIEALVRFHEKWKNNEGYLIAVNTDFEVPIHQNLILTGTWELIREVEINGQREIQLVIFTTNPERRKSSLALNRDLVMTAHSYAFLHNFKKKEGACVVYGLETGDFNRYTLEQDQYSLLKYTVSCVAQNIEDRRFPVCPSDKCSHCLYKVRCRMFMNDEANMKQLFQLKKEVKENA